MADQYQFKIRVVDIDSAKDVRLVTDPEEVAS